MTLNPDQIVTCPVCGQSYSLELHDSCPTNEREDKPEHPFMKPSTETGRVY